ncbi:hypothetical protein HDU97_000511 [Phlyctochytrium planicorne]|nr:hypothetical protein HDU97_000511 [Phlyctochytrium planicorne]
MSSSQRTSAANSYSEETATAATQYRPATSPPENDLLNVIVHSEPQLKTMSNEKLANAYMNAHGVSTTTTANNSMATGLKAEPSSHTASELMGSGTVAEFHERLLGHKRKVKPTFGKRMASLAWSFFNIALSDGSRVAMEAADPKAEDNMQDELMSKKSRNPLSIWKIMTSSTPTRQALENHVNTHNKEFERRFGYHMLFERASEGESILHFALLRKQLDIVEYLLECEDVIGDLVNLTYEGGQYWGEHAAHIAVVVFGDDPTWLKRLVNAGADVHTPRAIGSFFQINGPLYMGETILAFAACMNHHRIVTYLIEDVKVDPNILDHHGNNVLHVLAHWGDYSKVAPVSREDAEALAKPANNSSALYLEGVEKHYWSNVDQTTSPCDDAEEEEEDSDKKKPDPHVTQMYYYLAKMKHEVRSQEEFWALSEDDKKSYLSDLAYKADDTLSNVEGLTPFIVAVQHKRFELVQAILKFKATINWEYGPVRQERHCLSEIDTFVQRETMNHRKGALEIAISNKDIKIVNLPIFLKLLEAKWKLYGSTIFYSRLTVSFIYLVLLSAAIALLPNNINFYSRIPGDDKNLTTTSNPTRLNYFDLRNCTIDKTSPLVLPDGSEEACGFSLIPIIRFIVEIFLVFSNLLAMFREGVEISSSKSMYFRGFGALENLFQWLNILVFFSVVVFRFLPYGWADVYENTFLGIAAISGWISLLYFSKGSRRLGPLVTIFFRIILTDLITFVFLIAVFVIGFSEALYLQMAPVADYADKKGSDNVGLADWRWLGGGFVWGVRYVFGQGSYDDLRTTDAYAFTLILFLVAVLSITILLLNVFIAMLNNTFALVYAESEKQWRMSWANLIMEMDEKILAQYKQSPRKRPPITRIGIPRKATIVKPEKRIKEDQSKEDALTGTTAVTEVVDTEPTKKDHKKDSAKKWSGYIYDFVLEFKSGQDRPIRMFATFDETSPLFEDTSVSNLRKRSKISNRRDD